MQNRPRTLPQLLRIKDCAKILGISEGRMWRHVKHSKNGPNYVQPSKGILRIPYEDFMNWLNNRKT